MTSIQGSGALVLCSISSLTRQISHIRDMMEKFGSRISFLTVYIMEAHAADTWPMGFEVCYPQTTYVIASFSSPPNASSFFSLYSSLLLLHSGLFRSVVLLLAILSLITTTTSLSVSTPHQAMPSTRCLRLGLCDSILLTKTLYVL